MLRIMLISLSNVFLRLDFILTSTICEKMNWKDNGGWIQSWISTGTLHAMKLEKMYNA